MNVPERPTTDGLEEKWSVRWRSDGTYRFQDNGADVYSIDTPPPTVSGLLHMGHTFSYSHTDFIARYQRMRGRDVCYPMGWDDNGLPTERRVQDVYGVRCDPSLPYDPDLTLEPAEQQPPGRRPVAVSRRKFIELCGELTEQDEKMFEELWTTLGLSVDWSRTYRTIGDSARRISQTSFLRLIKRGDAYLTDAPTLWDVDFQTAVAQAEVEDREHRGTLFRLRFGGSQELEVETTRPELLPACVALVVHPEDKRYAKIIGQTATVPLFGTRVDVHAHPLADPEKGTGAAMVCTFGDVTDVTWWRDLQLRVRPVLGRDGRFVPIEWGSPGWESDDPGLAEQRYGALIGKRAAEARRTIAQLLRESGDLHGEPRDIVHAVKFYERGDSPLEIVSSRQWFVRTMKHRDDVREAARLLSWHPPSMRIRLERWVEGLAGDWAISRQRYFGVPFPVWYPVTKSGVDYANPIFADEADLPTDPYVDVPPGYSEQDRDVPGGFTGDKDVMDTWATSAVTPEVIGGWPDNDLFSRLSPFDLRPQAHDIIRTWLFYTLLRSWLEHREVPWKHVAISGWVVDPANQKMSKSKGNIVTPNEVLAEYGADAVRYWAAKGRPGSDTAYDTEQIRVGRRLSIKILNASRFVLSRPAPPGGHVSHPLDRALGAALADVVDEATSHFDEYNYSHSLEVAETFFWRFCGDYLEIVKPRAYGELGAEGEASARAALEVALSVQLRLFAPFLPYVTEEVWSWWQSGSVHRAPWPMRAELVGSDEHKPLINIASRLVADIRKVRNERSLSKRTPLGCVTVRAPVTELEALRVIERDVQLSEHVTRFQWEPADGWQLTVDVEGGDAT